MVGVAVLAILLGGPVAASRGFIRGLYLAEVNRFRDRSGRAASPELKAENDRMVEVYDRPWQSCGGGR